MYSPGWNDLWNLYSDRETAYDEIFYVPQLERNSLGYKAQGRQQKLWLNFAKFLDESWGGEKNPLNANLQPNQRL